MDLLADFYFSGFVISEKVISADAILATLVEC